MRERPDRTPPDSARAADSGDDSAGGDTGGAKGGGDPSASGLSRRVTIPNRRGLHARAAAKFVKLCEGFDAEVTVSRDGQSVGGRSIMGLMMLAAGQDSTIEISAEGPEAEAALDMLQALVEAGFHEAD